MKTETVCINNYTMTLPSIALKECAQDDKNKTRKLYWSEFIDWSLTGMSKEDITYFLIHQADWSDNVIRNMSDLEQKVCLLHVVSEAIENYPQFDFKPKNQLTTILTKAIEVKAQKVPKEDQLDTYCREFDRIFG